MSSPKNPTAHRRYIIQYLVFLFFLAPNLWAQPDIIWSRTFGSSSLDHCYAVRQTEDNGFILAGVNSSSSANGADFWLVKTDENGNMLWENTFGGTANEYAYSVSQTFDGGYVLTGFTESFGAGGRDIWLVKTDEAGNLLWSKTIGLTGWDEGRAVIQTDDHGFIVSGSFTSYFTGTVDVFLAKFDLSGEILWIRFFGDSGTEAGLSVQQTSEGGFVIAGFTSSWGAGSDDLYLIKTDSQGYTEWDQTFGGSYADLGRSVQQTTDGCYVITGYTSSVEPGNKDVWLIKTDEEGNLQWSRTYGGTKVDEGTYVQQTYGGGYVVSATTGSYGAGSHDLWIIKSDPSGNLQWDMTFGGSDWDRGHFVEQTSDGGYIAAGDTRSFGAGSSDAMLVRFAPETGIGYTDTNNRPAFIRIPNPIHTSSGSVIEFYQPASSIASIAVYDLSGRKVQTLTDRFFTQGINAIEWYPSAQLTPGCYLLQLWTTSGSQCSSCILLD